MKIQGEHTFNAPRERVWRALLDPEVLARTLPGCERLERTGENEYRGVLNVQVGPVKGQFQGTLQLAGILPLEGYHMKLDGSGPSGFMNGQGELRLADAPAGTTLRYDLDTQIGGRIAGLGQRLVESSAKSITRQGLEGLARELALMTDPRREETVNEETVAAAPAPSIASVPPAPPPARPTQAEVAARVAGDVARDLVPAEKRPWVIGVGLALLAILVFLLARSCG
jgi:carbon monoxide dehydrogenase subunit G